MYDIYYYGRYRKIKKKLQINYIKSNLLDFLANLSIISSFFKSFDSFLSMYKDEIFVNLLCTMLVRNQFLMRRIE